MAEFDFTDSPALVAKFWERVHPEPNTGCWLWSGAKKQKGQPWLGFGRKARNLSAPRLAWQMLRGPLPDDTTVRNACGVSACVNPEHYVAGAWKHPEPCAAEGCDRPSLAKGYCNVHYTRNRKGVAMDKPIAVRNGTCKYAGCDEPNFGAGYCKRHYPRFRRWSATSRLVALLGGKCRRCGGVFPVAAFDFHHRNPAEKSFAISEQSSNRPYEALVSEALKCDLLCANCHRILHFGGFLDG